MYVNECFWLYFWLKWANMRYMYSYSCLTSAEEKDYMVAVKGSWNRPLWFSIDILRKWSWNGHLYMTLGKILCMVIVQLSKERALQVDTIVLLERWSLNGHLLMTLRKNLQFIVQVSQERALCLCIIALLRRWFWNIRQLGHDTGEDTAWLLLRYVRTEIFKWVEL